MKNQNIYSHLTAKERDKLSFPMSKLKQLNLLKGELLDFGCGHGTDVKLLSNEGFNIVGYDKYYHKNYPTQKFDTITCIYVLNVIEPLEQSDILMSISELLNPGGKAYFVVRRDLKREGYRMHFVHKKPTYQTNVRLPFESIYSSESCEIYEYQHYNLVHKQKSNCIFCTPNKDVIIETALAFAIFDKFPVNEGHVLIIPKTHTPNYFDLGLNEQISINLIINKVKKIIDQKFNPNGYNIGINIGKHAGQTVEHAHVHLIPRYKDDVSNPIGGIRNVIPDKGNYLIRK